MTAPDTSTAPTTSTMGGGPEAVRASIARYCLALPHMEPILKTFQPLLEEKARLTEAFAAEELDLSTFDFSRLQLSEKGLSLLSGQALAPLAPWLARSAAALLPVLRETLPASEVGEALAQGLELEGETLAKACELLLTGDEAGLATLAEKTCLSAPFFTFGLEQIAGPPLAALARKALARVPEYSWPHGHCPVCAGQPSLATLGRPEPVDLESLVGGGGQKELHCSRCATAWRFRRDACPACGNAEPGTRQMFHAQKAKQERIEACSACKAYLPCIDLREYADDPDITVAPLALMYLDLVAAERGYAPLTRTPWNTPAEDAAEHDAGAVS